MNRREQLKEAGLRGGADFTDSCLTSQIPGSVIDINSLRLSFCKGCINDICIQQRGVYWNLLQGYRVEYVEDIFYRLRGGKNLWQGKI